MTATILAFPQATRPQPADPRAAIREVLLEATYRDLGDGRVALTLPTRVVERLYVAAIGEDEA